MAITKIHAIKATLHKSIEYICNPHKTDNRILVDTFCCGIDTAEYDFKFANMNTASEKNSSLAFHLIQSFAPGEVSFDEAHQIGQELIDAHLSGKHSYVLATHIDKDHVHNHIIFCATDNFSHKRYHDCKSTYREIRNISDKLCREHHLSVITPGPGKSMTYKEWNETRANNSIKYQLKCDIRSCTYHAKDYDHFLSLMEEKGYEIKNAYPSEKAGKYISFRPAVYSRFIRGSGRTLGNSFTRESIQDKIENLIQTRQEWKKQQDSLPLSMRAFIDTDSLNDSGNDVLLQWASTTNLQIAASAYAEAGSLSALNQTLDELKETITLNKKRILELSSEQKHLSELLKYSIQYTETKEFYEAYQKSKNPEEYLMEHESKILLFEGAKEKLASFKMNLDTLSIEEINKKRFSLSMEKDELVSTTSALTEKQKQLSSCKVKLEQYFSEPPKDHNKPIR